MKVISFLRDRISILIWFILFGTIMTVVSYLSGESLDAIFYGLIICGFCLLIDLVLSYFGWKEKILQLLMVKKAPIEAIDELPEAHTAIEREYKEIVSILQKIYVEKEVKQIEFEDQTRNYYDLWIHQIKTPIAALKLLVQKQENDSYRRQQEQELLRIEQYAQMALCYNSLTIKNDDLVIKTCDLYHIVKESLKKFSVSFIEKKLGVEIEEFKQVVVTDEKWLGLILEQILSNSMKYTREGSIAIRLLAERETKETVQLLIEDTGIGIHAEDIPRIFEKGYTGYNGHLDRKSTGIGLYICKLAADSIGVKLKVESELERGTRAYLTIMKG